MLENRSPQIFFPNNTGREPLLIYLLAVAGAIENNGTVFRLVNAFVGTLTISLLYRWLVSLFGDSPNRYWIGLFGAAGLALSFWHVLISRTVYRAGLLIPLAILTFYFCS